MHAELLVGFSEGLSQAGIATLRFNFPYKERGGRAPDPMPRLLETYASAVAETRARATERPLFLSGKSLGGRVASMLVADGEAVAGLVFLGYPLHPPGKPERARDSHLGSIDAPMLFIQGTADPFARFDLLTGLVDRLGERSELFAVEGGDHSFRVRGARRADEEIGRDLAKSSASFVARMLD